MFASRVAKPIGALVAATVLAACAQADQPSVRGTPEPRTTPVESRATPVASPSAAAIELASVVIGPDEAPAGLSHDETVIGPETLTSVIISGRDEEFRALQGFLDGRAEYFSTETEVLLSMALAFDSDFAADIAMHRYQNELRDDVGYGFGAGESTPFAFEGVCDTGPNPAFDGLEESICIWRNGELVLIDGGTLSMTEIRALAEEMNDRATP